VRSVQRMVKKYVTRSGLAIDATPHTLRHTFATGLLQEGADLRSVQELLGHANVATTQIYTHVTSKRLKEAHKKFHKDVTNTSMSPAAETSLAAEDVQTLAPLPSSDAKSEKNSKKAENISQIGTVSNENAAATPNNSSSSEETTPPEDASNEKPFISDNLAVTQLF
jgi:hypothetical protein